MPSRLESNLEKYRRQGKPDAWLQSYRRGWEMPGKTSTGERNGNR